MDDDRLFQTVLNNTFNEARVQYNASTSIVDINVMMDNIAKVENVFNQTNAHTLDCSICFDTSKCIKCSICEIWYCKMCLIRVISQFYKCSSCQNKINLEDILKKSPKINNKTNNPNNPNNANNANNRNTNNIVNSEIINGLNNNTLTNNLDNNLDNDLYNDLYNEVDTGNISAFYSMGISTSSSDGEGNIKTIAKTNKNIHLKKSDFNYVKYFVPDNERQKFKARYNPDLDCLVFISNYRKHANINIDYKIFSTCIQRQMYTYMNCLCKSETKFISKWNIIANTVHNLSNFFKTETISINDKNKKLLETIEQIIMN